MAHGLYIYLEQAAGVEALEDCVAPADQGVDSSVHGGSGGANGHSCQHCRQKLHQGAGNPAAVVNGYLWVQGTNEEAVNRPQQQSPLAHPKRRWAAFCCCAAAMRVGTGSGS